MSQLKLSDTSDVRLPSGRVLDFFVAVEIIHHIDNHRRDVLEMLGDPDLLEYVRSNVMNPARLTEVEPLSVQYVNALLVAPVPGLQ